MKIKTFYAKTMAEALQDIKAELGSDALLLSTKEIPSRSRADGSASGFEVVAAADDMDQGDLVSFSRHGSSLLPAVGGGLSQESAGASLGALSAGPMVYSSASLRSSFPGPAPAPAIRKRTRATPRRKKAGASPPKAQPLPLQDPLSLRLCGELIASGIQEQLARRLLGEAEGLIIPKQRRTRAALLRSLTRVAASLIADPPSGDGIPSKRVVVLFGPTGVGKTTSIAKLAARLALQQKKKVVLMTLDSYRIGAVEQLRTYAGLMGIPFRFVGDIGQLPEAIRDHSKRDFILIDTTGRGPKDMDTMKGLAEFLQSADQVERHLVLSATTKPADISEIVDRFEICRPDHLLFTKLDETSTLGPILNELIRTHKSLSYYSDGQTVPDDLHAILPERIVDIVLHRI